MARLLSGILILATAMITGYGCEKPAESPYAPAQRAATDAANKAAIETKTAADLKIAADLKAASETKAATDAMIAADRKAAADSKSASDVKTTADVKAATDAKTAADVKTGAEIKAAADAVVKTSKDNDAAKATSLLTLLQQLIKDNEVDTAEKTLNQLDRMKDTLSASMQEEIETARSALTAKKAATASAR